MSKFDTQIETVWVDPPSFDPLHHGPPYLPRKEAPVKLASDLRAKVQGWVKQADLGPEMAGNLQGMAHEVTTGPLGYMSATLSYLRAAAMVHQTAHWQTRGVSFYGDHLLFERLYNDSLPGIDALAERTVGRGEGKLVDAWTQAKHLERCIAQCYAGTKIDEGPNGLVEISLHMEYHVLEAIRITLGILEGSGTITDGTENLLQDIADKHEEFVYLLKQRSAVTPYSYGR